jgi:hypothetical protein
VSNTSVSTSRNLDRRAANQASWSWVTVAVVLFTVVAVTGIVAAISYDHETYLATANGQPGWVSTLNPFTIDGLILGSTVVLFWAASRGIRGFTELWRPGGVLVVGILATVGGNLAAGITAAWLRPAVSAWPGVALVLISDVGFWLMGKIRTMGSDAPAQPAVACTCPKPATSLAAALPLARAQLRDEGKPHGELALADAFGVTRHQIRVALASAVDPTMRGLESTAAAAELNGHSADVALS